MMGDWGQFQVRDKQLHGKFISYINPVFTTFITHLA
jgi:hypothetical protein